MDIVVSSAAALGISLHQLFRRREPTIASALAIVAGADAALFAILERLELGLPASTLVYSLGGTTFATLLLSIAAYRLSPWHPLARYPGPLLHRLTKLRTVYASWRGNHFKEMAKIHDKYGPVVRMAPNAISIADVSAVAPVLGANGLPKDRYYRARQPPGNGPLITLNGAQHAHRRRLWNRGLGKSALTSHTQTAAAGWGRLRTQFDRAADAQTTVDMSLWLRFYGFDFMGGFAFGKEFGLVESGKDDVKAWQTINKFLIAHDIIGHLPWLGWRGAFIPSLLSALFKLRNFARKCVQDRLARPATTLDLWYYLSKEDADDNDGRLTVEKLAAEGSLALVAGADTSATAMISMIYFLLTNPDCLSKAREEVDAAVANGLAPWTNAECHPALPYLNACMDETLRLLPVVPTNGSRVVPIGSGGITIAGHFIPEDTEVFVAPYQLHHDPRYFSPHTSIFHPERWIEDDGKWNTQREAYIPFSAGPMQCVGKNLAKIEIIVVVSALLRYYDMKFAEGYDPAMFLEHVEEHIVADVPPLPVVLTKRL
ncbi:cytochrome P450 [Exidia glandulosa HHB12029]|uniref:Cytochrome P450 n=1 Tax=Exidia glandulosa HHB12029 TaxID=1314781 RepID=A0A165JY58_EXIGL|nr:cytochrome P450 [Exidia glandulosa HHB12029]